MPIAWVRRVVPCVTWVEPAYRDVTGSDLLSRDVATAVAMGTDSTRASRNGGTLTVDFVLLPDVVESVAVQPDGMVVLGGFEQQGFDGYGLARVLP